MQKSVFAGLCLLGSLLAGLPGLAQADPNHPFPQHVAYAADTIKPDARSQAQLDGDVRAFYDHWKAAYLRQEGAAPDGQPLYRVNSPGKETKDSNCLKSKDRHPNRTVSEGQGYGMVIVALMAGYDPDARTVFDGLWRFSRQHPSSGDSRLMGWLWFPGDCQEDSAFDGDADIAYGLLLADKQWGSGGAVDYAAAAKAVIAGIQASTVGPNSRLPTLGDWVERDGRKYNQYTPRSSDFMPAHFRAYRRFTRDPAWDQVVASTQAVIAALQAVYSPATGLLPDFVSVPHPAPAIFLEGNTKEPYDGAYYYNAGRVPWRIGLDVLLNGNPLSRAQVGKLSTWMQAKAQGDPANIKAGYKLSGAAIGDYFSTFFVAPFGVAAMCDPAQQAWLNAIYEAVYKQYDQGYYEDSITLLSLLAMSGNYWDPTQL